MQGNIPFELAGAAARAVVLIQRPIARQKFGIFVTKQTKPVSGQAGGLPLEIRADTEAPDVTQGDHAPSGRELPNRSQADDWVDPVLVAESASGDRDLL